MSGNINLHNGREFKVVVVTSDNQHRYQLMLKNKDGEFESSGGPMCWQDFRRQHRISETSPHEKCNPYWSNPYG